LLSWLIDALYQIRFRPEWFCTSYLSTKPHTALIAQYMPEDVRPQFFQPDVQSERATNVTLDQILQKQEFMARKTKIICTAGPGWWSSEMLSKVRKPFCAFCF